MLTVHLWCSILERKKWGIWGATVLQSTVSDIFSIKSILIS